MKRICYRVYTEDVGDIEELVRQSNVSACTILRGTGQWEGTTEKSAVIEVVGEDTHDLKLAVWGLCSIIRLENNQQAVMLTSHSVEMEMF